jgi:uncharacterized membrane protein
MGARMFQLFYTAVAIVTIVLFVNSYREVLRYEYWWGPDPSVYWLAKVLMWFSLVLAVGSFMAPNPSITGMGSSLRDAQMGPRGILRITRHPFMWGTVIWSLAHIVANGDAVSVIFFGWFGLLALGGMWAIDAKKLREFGADWSRFCDQSSLVPFAAVAAGRGRLPITELALPLAAGTVAYGLIYWGHKYVSGVSLLFN